jgi:hypothetical protein
MIALGALTAAFGAIVTAKENKEKEKEKAKSADQTQSTFGTPSASADPPASTTGQSTSTAPPTSTTGQPTSPAPTSTTGQSTSPAQPTSTTSQPTSTRPPWVIGPTPTQVNEGALGQSLPVDISSELHPKLRLDAVTDGIIIAAWDLGARSPSDNIR